MGAGGLALGRQIPTFGFENHRGLISQVFITSGAQHRYFKNSADSALGEPESNRKMSAHPSRARALQIAPLRSSIETAV